MSDNKTKLIRNSTAEFLIFTGQAGEQSIEARYEDQSIWLTQRLMAELFDTTPENVLMHLKNIFKDNELGDVATAKDFLVVRQEDKRTI